MRARSTKCVVNVINNSVHVRPVVYPSNPSLSIRAGMTVKSPVWDLFFHSDHSTSDWLHRWCRLARARRRWTRPLPPFLPVSNLWAPDAVQRCSRRLVWTCIMNLKDIFNFTVSNSSLDFYWKDGELNLEKQRVSVEQDHIDELGLDVGQSRALPLGQQ